jgi:hypothetical protein
LFLTVFQEEESTNVEYTVQLVGCAVHESDISRPDGFGFAIKSPGSVAPVHLCAEDSQSRQKWLSVLRPFGMHIETEADFIAAASAVSRALVSTLFSQSVALVLASEATVAIKSAPVCTPQERLLTIALSVCWRDQVAYRKQLEVRSVFTIPFVYPLTFPRLQSVSGVLHAWTLVYGDE